MIRNAISVFPLCLLLYSVATADEGFTELFNGKDLSGWINPPGSGWVVEDGAIALQQDVDGKEHNHEYLWTEQEYGDFVLELEFKVPERANSGVFLRTADMKDPVSTGLEIQVCNSYGRDTLTRGGTAGCGLRLPGPVGQPDQEAGRVEQVPHHLPIRTWFKWNSTTSRSSTWTSTAGPSRTRTPTARRTSSPRLSRISPGSVESACRTMASRSGTATFASNDWRRTCIR